MAKQVKYTKFSNKLSLEFIDSSCDTIYNFLIDNQADHRFALAMRLQFEEILSNYHDFLGEDADVTIVLRRIGGELRVALNIPGANHNPFAIDSTDEYSNILGQFIGGYSNIPIWTYKKGANHVSLTTSRKIKLPSIVSTILAIVLALLAALLCSKIEPANKDILLNSIVTPIFNTLFNIIKLMAGPLIFLSVLSGILNIGDRTTLAKICGNIIFRSAILLYIFTILPILICVPIYKISKVEDSGFDISGVISLFLDIIPSNIIDPFLNGNTLQLFFLAACVGFVMLLLGDKITVLDSVIFDLNSIVQHAMKSFCKIMPVFVFLSLFSMLSTQSLQVLLDLILPSILFIGFTVVFQIGYLLYTSARNHIKIKDLFDAISPATILAFSTASSIAAYEDTKKGCVKMGVSPKIYNVGIPLGQIAVETCFSCILVFFSFAIAKSNGIVFSSDIILKMLLAVPILAFAVPPVPGGGIATYSIAIVLFGLPLETIGLFATVDAITDYISTQNKVFNLQLMLINTSRSLQKKEDMKTA